MIFTMADSVDVDMLFIYILQDKETLSCYKWCKPPLWGKHYKYQIKAQRINREMVDWFEGAANWQDFDKWMGRPVDGGDSVLYSFKSKRVAMAFKLAWG